MVQLNGILNLAVKAKDIAALHDLWNGRTTVLMGNVTGAGLSTNAVLPSASYSEAGKNGTMVYVTKSGKRYHNNPNCSKMKNPIEMDLLDAIEKGFEPCGRCYR